MGFWGYLLDVMGRRLRHKALYIKGYNTLLDVLGSVIGGGGGNRTRYLVF